MEILINQKILFVWKKGRYKGELLGRAMNAPSVLTMSVLLVFMSLLWFPLYDPYFSQSKSLLYIPKSFDAYYAILVGIECKKMSYNIIFLSFTNLNSAVILIPKITFFIGSCWISGKPVKIIKKWLDQSGTKLPKS